MAKIQGTKKKKLSAIKYRALLKLKPNNHVVKKVIERDVSHRSNAVDFGSSGEEEEDEGIWGGFSERHRGDYGLDNIDAISKWNFGRCSTSNPKEALLVQVPTGRSPRKSVSSESCSEAEESEKDAYDVLALLKHKPNIHGVKEVEKARQGGGDVSPWLNAIDLGSSGEDEGIWGSSPVDFSKTHRGDYGLDNTDAISKWNFGRCSTYKEAPVVQVPTGRSLRRSESSESYSGTEGSEKDAHDVHLGSVQNTEFTEVDGVLQEGQRRTDQTSEPLSDKRLKEVEKVRGEVSPRSNTVDFGASKEDEGIWGSSPVAVFSKTQRGDYGLDNIDAISKWNFGRCSTSTPKEAGLKQVPIGRSPRRSESSESCSRTDESEKDAHDVHLGSVKNTEFDEVLQERQRGDYGLDNIDALSKWNFGKCSTSNPKEVHVGRRLRRSESLESYSESEESEKDAHDVRLDVDKVLQGQRRTDQTSEPLSTDIEKDMMEEFHQKFIHDLDTRIAIDASLNKSGTLGSHQDKGKGWKDELKPTKDLPVRKKSDTMNHSSKSRRRTPNSSRSASPKRIPRRNPRLRSTSPVRQLGMQDRQTNPRSSASKAPEPSLSNHGRSFSRNKSPDGRHSKRVRKGRGFTNRYSYVRKFRTPSPEHSPPRSFRYGGRNAQDKNRDRFGNYKNYTWRRSPTRYPDAGILPSPSCYRNPPLRRSPTRYPDAGVLPLASCYRSPPWRGSPTRYPDRNQHHTGPDWLQRWP